MQTDNENRDLKYCRYYHGEQQDPYRDSFKGRAWMAEQLASERASDSAKDFLSFVAAHISKWEPYGYEPDVARYIAFFEGCSFEFYTPDTIDVGVLLYYDGSVYIKNVSLNPCIQAYFYEGKYKETADAVKKLITENWERISALPSKYDDIVCDAGFLHYKFLSKHFKGMIYGGSNESKAVEDFHNQVLNIFYRMNAPSYAWLDVTTDADTFVEQWGMLLDEIDADESRAKVYDFIESERFAEDCRNLGFEMDCFESFTKHCNRDSENTSGNSYKELFAVCTDYHVLGNAIFSQWRYYNHWADDVKAEFNTMWFRLAFKRLLELAE